MKNETLIISGMNCNHCVMAVKNELAEGGIIVHSVEIGKADISYDENTINVEKIADLIDDAGFSLTERIEKN